MEPAAQNQEPEELKPDVLPFARTYQLEALETALKQNTIVFLETGSGKTLIAIMLLRTFGHLIRKPSPYIAVFLVPTVVLVTQQGEAIQRHTDLKVGKFCGEMGVDFWDECMWRREMGRYEVLILTPAILLSALRHSFLKIEMIKLLIFDECHNARGKHPYSCIMKEFYHRQLQSGNVQLPRIFGMTASPIKAKASSSGDSYWEGICALENLMNSKIYTCASESVLAAYISFPTSEVRTYNDIGIPYQIYESIHDQLHRLRDEYVAKSNLSKTTAKAVRKRLTRLLMTFLYCLVEMGAFLAIKAAESLSCKDKDIFNWHKLNMRAESVVRGFCLDAAKILSAQMHSGAQSYVSSDLQGDTGAGYLTSKVFSLIGILLEYRDIKDLRCIIFVERIVTAIVLPSLLNELLPKLTGWQTKYTAGNGSKLQAQSRKVQNTTVEEFRKGIVNIIVATSILEEGLDVQSCNLVIRFDPSATVCSFIQSRGRARMQNSHFILLVNREDVSTLDKVRKYLESGEIMRKESLSHASQPCLPIECDRYDEYSYKVDSTGAMVNLRSSVSLLNLYCSRLPSDRYFKPAPRFDVDKDAKTCILYLPKSCQITKVEVEGDVKILKQLACLEACKQLHLVGALTDNLVPEIMEKKEDTQETGYVNYNDKQPKYHPPELIGCHGNDPETEFYCYLIELSQYSIQGTQLQNVILAVKMKLEFGDEEMAFDLNVDGDVQKGRFYYFGQLKLTHEKINSCRMFQVILLSALMHKDLNKLAEALDRSRNVMGFATFDYLLLPSSGSGSNPSVNWSVIDSLCFSSSESKRNHTNCLSMHDYSPVHTKTGLVCSCRLKNSLICTPHNGSLYHITDLLRTSNGNSTLKTRKGKSISYKDHFKEGHGIDLFYEGEALLNGKFLPTVQNYLQKSSTQKAQRNLSIELPPEVCSVIMSPITYDVLCSFTYVPSIMHRIESLLLALNLKKLHMDHCTQNANVPIYKILEATTTKKCLENFHLESLETLGDAFLKYAAGQQLFTTHQDAHEGILSLKKEKMVSNATLCQLACSRSIPGFIHTEPFDPKTWLIPGDYAPGKSFAVELVSPSRKIYSMEQRKMKGKRVADAVEALIGAYVSTAGEAAALSFMAWLGLDIHFNVGVPITRSFPISADKFVNVEYVQDLLKYKFNDPSLLVEALTHGSFMQSDIPRCYQRLEFLGDAVLDYIITVHLYSKHPGLTPGLLTDLRSCSVNNDCYALCAVKAELHKQVLYFSTDLQKHITDAVDKVEKLRVSSTFGWESEISFPKVLGDIIESLAGAILVDSGFNKNMVYESMIPLLEPMVTPETLTLHPVRELYELCLSWNYKMKKPRVTLENGVATIAMEVEDANGVTHRDSCTAPNKVAAKKQACSNLLKKLKSPKG